MQRSTQLKAPGSRCRALTVQPRALFGRKPAAKAAEPPAKTTKGKAPAPSKTTSSKGKAAPPPPPKRKEAGFLSQAVQALDFSEVRSQSDADLLYEAKYGKLKDGKMSPEQYAALRRKIGGTSQDFFKTWVEEEQLKYIKTYTKETDINQSVPFLPVLVAVVVGMLVATVVVVSKTS